MYDLNEVKPETRELIPIGTPLFVEITFTPGGHGEHGLLTKSKPTPDRPNPDTAYLKCEFTVLRGPYKNRKFWSNLTLEGGEVDEKGNSKAVSISLQSIRRIVDSAHGLKSDDMTPQAREIRARYNDPRALRGLRFVTLAAVSKEQPGYPQKNELGGHWNILTVDSKRWPSERELDNPQTGKPAAPAPAAPVWNNGGATPPAAQANPPQPPAAGSATAPGGFTATPTLAPAIAAQASKASDLPQWMLGGR